MLYEVITDLNMGFKLHGLAVEVKNVFLPGFVKRNRTSANHFEVVGAFNGFTEQA